MQTLYDLLDQDKRLMRDAVLPPEAYRAVAAGAVEIFHEASIRSAVPVTMTNLGPGAIKSRRIKLVGTGAAMANLKGTGGTFGAASYAMDDQFYLPIYVNIEVPMREQEASKLGGVGLDLFRDSGRDAAAEVVEKENELIIKGLNQLKGISTATGIQTSAGNSWATAGNAYKDILKARKLVKDKKAPVEQLAMLVNQQEEQNLMMTFSNTDAAQLEKIAKLFPGGIYTSTQVTAGKAYIYPKTPTVVDFRVAQDLTVIPLPRTDEDDRMRVRVIPTIHFPRPDAIVELTGLT